MIKTLRTPLPWLVTALLVAFATAAQAAPQHALTLYDEKPKYPADFSHFDYVNPHAPKGGVLRQAGFGSFDTLNPFINKGVSADDIGLVYDTLTVNSLDEPFSVYGSSPRRSKRRRTIAGFAFTCGRRRASMTVPRSPPRTWSSPSTP